MKKKIGIISLVILILSLSGFFFFYLRKSMNPATVMRNLSGLRLSAEFFRSSHGRMPNNFEEVINAGNLEEIPKLKLKWHFAKRRINLRDGHKIKNTGSWAYVNNPKSPFFGTVFIDSDGKDNKDRYWSWF